MILNYVVIVFIIIFLSDESYGKKELILTEYIMNVNHRKILLKEQEALEIEYVFLVVRIKILLIKEIKIKILI